MHAFSLKKYRAVDGFALTELPTPRPRKSEARIKVLFSAFGPADCKVARGIVKFLHGRKFPLVLGYETFRASLMRWDRARRVGRSATVFSDSSLWAVEQPWCVF
jgi:hypothetical protein